VKLFHVRDEFGVWSTFTSREIIHARAGYCFDGLRSISPVKFAAQQIGAGLAMERFMNDFWRNGAIPTAVLTTSKSFTDPKQSQRLANRFLRTYRGRRRGVVVLEDGMTFTPLSWSHVDAQFMEQKRELVETIARVWRCPLGKLMTQISGTSQTYRNQEQERYELYGDAVLPKAIRIESALRRDRDLYPRGSGMFPQFDADQVLRADSLTRAKVNQIRAGGAAWARTDEIRADENRAPDAELAAKQLEAPASAPALGSGNTVP
jgi:HK97 family phage portal protein